MISEREWICDHMGRMLQTRQGQTWGKAKRGVERKRSLFVSLSLPPFSPVFRTLPVHTPSCRLCHPKDSTFRECASSLFFPLCSEAETERDVDRISSRNAIEKTIATLLWLAVISPAWNFHQPFRRKRPGAGSPT